MSLRRCVLVAVGALTMVAGLAPAAGAGVTPANVGSRYFAGYQKAVMPTLMTSRFTIPPVDCFTGPHGMYLGVGRSSGHNVTEIVGVAVTCDSGNSGFELYDVVADSPVGTAPAAEGDVVTVRLELDSIGQFEGTVTDLTSGASLVERSVPATFPTAQFGAFPFTDPTTGALLAPPVFGRLRFIDNQLDGVPLASAGMTAVNRYSAAGLEIKTIPLGPYSGFALR